MRAHFLQHIWFEDGGTIVEILRDRGFEISSTQFDEDESLPLAVDDIDLLVVMGGFMSVNDEDEYPWLKTEKAFIGQAIEKGVKVLGICLGAQLIASALGAKVYKNAQKEIGWHKIYAKANSFLPEEALVFHWHGETFDLPNGAICLASSAACKNQAFISGDNVVALQFHLETTREGAKLLVENCRDELINAPYIQSPDEILNAPAENYQTIKKIMANLLSFLLP
jgi:GMP synthase-like glutamine amidotransferase